MTVSIFTHVFCGRILNYLTIPQFNLSILLLMDIWAISSCLAIINKAAMTTSVLVSWCAYGKMSPGYVYTEELKYWVCMHILSYIRYAKFFSICVRPMYPPVSMFRCICYQALSLCLPTLLFCHLS